LTSSDSLSDLGSFVSVLGDVFEGGVDREELGFERVGAEVQSVKLCK